MPDHLADHIKRFIDIDEKDIGDIQSYFKHLKVAKKENLLTEGKVCTSNYFIVKGCLRMFFVNDKGVEQTTHFALENWWLADYSSFMTKKPSEFYIQAVEKSEVMLISNTDQEKMLKHFPQMEKYYRIIHQRATAASQFRIKNLYNYSREELYRNFNELYPEFVQRVPQYLLASFLGFTPEYLSEIRKKKIS